MDNSIKRKGQVPKNRKQTPRKTGLTTPHERVATLAELFSELARIVTLNLELEEDSAERQRLALNASKELRAILADIAAEAGGRGGQSELGILPDMKELSDADLRKLIDALKEADDPKIDPAGAG